jgi:hypothetical protein
LSQQEEEEQSLTTRYFTIYYPRGEEKAAQWYAGFVDEVNVAVSELLGGPAIEGMTLRIYANEPDYMRANPMAELHPGIMAHAIPEQKEIGVAVERLRQQPAHLARESFRHEITHIVAGDLSDQNLPIGFHEGLAQYNELSESRGREVYDLLTQVRNAGLPFLSLEDLNDVRVFRRNIQVAYPQSYAVMAFIADRYGMEPFVNYLNTLREGRRTGYAFFTAFGKRMDDMDREWREWMPSFLADGWKENLFMANDLSYGLALYQAGRFAEAETHFSNSERLYTGLGRNERAQEAVRYLSRASQARLAEESTGQARKLLEEHHYAAAHKRASEAAGKFSTLDLPDHQKRASDISQLAQRGIDGLAHLEKARAGMGSFNLPAAQQEARAAGEAFASLGDGGRVAEVNTILQELHGWQSLAGYAVLGAGALVVLGGGVAILRGPGRRARRREAARVAALREESPSWL